MRNNATTLPLYRDHAGSPPGAKRISESLPRRCTANSAVTELNRPGGEGTGESALERVRRSSCHAGPLVAFASAVSRVGTHRDATGLAAFKDTEFGPHGKMIRYLQGLFHG